MDEVGPCCFCFYRQSKGRQLYKALGVCLQWTIVPAGNSHDEEIDVLRIENAEHANQTRCSRLIEEQLTESPLYQVP